MVSNVSNVGRGICLYIRYEQAEKDLELTVDDIKSIDRLLNQCVDYSNPYQEVLKRFKETKRIK